MIYVRHYNGRISHILKPIIFSTTKHTIMLIEDYFKIKFFGVTENGELGVGTAPIKIKSIKLDKLATILFYHNFIASSYKVIMLK